MLASALLLCLAQLPDQVAPQATTFEVLATTPGSNALAVDPAAPVSVDFSLPVDPATLHGGSMQVMGRWSALVPGGLSLSPDGRTATFTPARPFSSGETVSVFLSRELASTGGAALAKGYSFAFWTRSRAGTDQYTLIATFDPGQTPYGGYGGDLDGDADLDLVIVNEDSEDVAVYLNQGTSLSGPVHYATGEHGSPSEAGDFDGDGRLDLAVANILDDDVSVLFGNGDGTFQTQVRYPVGREPRGLAMLDADGDGDLDLVTANRLRNDLSLLLNRGDGSFAPELPLEAGVGQETGVFACEMDQDGLPDLVVIGYGSDQGAVLLGDGDAGFSTHAVRALGANPWMLACGDVDGDGDNDLAAVLSGAAQVAVAMNDGSGGLQAPATYATGAFPLAVDLGDLDGDGDLDLVASAFLGDFDLYSNLGNGAFGNHRVLPSTIAGSCTILHDLDGDLDLDISAVDEIADRLFLFNQDG